MADNRSIYNAQNNLRRNFQDGVEISKDTKTGIELALVAQVMAGRVNEATVILQMLSKTQEQANMAAIINQMSKVIGKLGGQSTETAEITE